MKEFDEGTGRNLAEALQAAAASAAWRKVESLFLRFRRIRDIRLWKIQGKKKTGEAKIYMAGGRGVYVMEINAAGIVKMIKMERRIMERRIMVRHIRIKRRNTEEGLLVGRWAAFCPLSLK